MFIVQRLSGAVLAAFVALHLVGIGYAVQDGLSVAEISGRVQGHLLWIVFYGAFVVVALGHAAIGLRNILIEMLKLPGRVIDAAVGLYLVGGIYLGFSALRAIL